MAKDERFDWSKIPGGQGNTWVPVAVEPAFDRTASDYNFESMFTRDMTVPNKEWPSARWTKRKKRNKGISF